MTNPSVLETTFFAALAKPTDAERSAYLDQACAENPDLRRQVEKMLAAHFEAEEFLEQPAVTVDVNIRNSPSITEVAGSTIGPFKLLQQIGEGGMGVVFMAEQLAPIRRFVALKIIKQGMDTRQVIARLEAERQALAMMDHPNVAKVLDAGTTAGGRPYFVMELVKGVPITKYCDDRKLSLRARLDLFVPICMAVQHAHQKGLIHRDIKPTNVLVAEYDNHAVPKVIDFGVAKATAQPMTERTLFTEYGQVVGTVEYMSPEQAKLNQLDIDTRSDIYSLGVLMYELLTGTTPFGQRRLKEAAFDEMLRIIRDEEPQKPSTRLSTVDALPSIAANRGVESVKLNRQVRGELDWIAMKCLEKDRARRYESAAALASDISHYLSGLPVSAGAPSFGYRVRRFTGRHRVAVLVSTGFVALLATTAAVTTIGFIEQRRLRLEADQQRTAAEQSAVAAKEQREIAEAVSQFQTDMFASADPERGKGDKLTVLEAMIAAIAELDKNTSTPPLVEANVRNIIASTLRQLGRSDLAEPNIRKALELRRKFLGPDDKLIRVSLSQTGAILLDLGRLGDAAKHFEEIVATDGTAAVDERSKNRHNLSVIYRQLGRLDEAEAMAREVLAAWRITASQQPRQLSNALANLAAILCDKQKLDEAESLSEEALRINRQTFPPGNTAIAEAINNLASIHQMQNHPAEAEAGYRESLIINRAALPAGHPTICMSLISIANILIEQEKYADADPLSREAVELARQTFGNAHPNLAMALHTRAGLLLRVGQVPDSIRMEEESLAILRKALPPGHLHIANVLDVLGAMYATSGNLAECERAYREALAIRVAGMPSDHPDVKLSRSNLEAAIAGRARAATQSATAPAN